VFNGKIAAARRQAAVRAKVNQLNATVGPITMASIFFTEDEGSVLYTKLKHRAAESAGMVFHEYQFSMAAAGMDEIKKTLQFLHKDPAITGIIIQKPIQRVWLKAYPHEIDFDDWWHELTDMLSVSKDIDCLTAANLDRLRHDATGILPATVKAVLIVLEEALHKKILPPFAKANSLSGLSASVVGCSDIIGLPLADVLEWYGCEVTRICSRLKPADLKHADLVVSATGAQSSITGDMIKSGAIVIDVGAPQGDVDFASTAKKAAFITPVPGGVGPLTVVSLLENTLALADARISIPA
jgi:methylenetetrahydrofolate dehydrogenase (NADP+)/methenyltetrahydrofolate cyclohydrolase